FPCFSLSLFPPTPSSTLFPYTTLFRSGETLIGLNRGLANVSLEPGGQFELSGAPLGDMHDICEETGQHLEEVKEVAGELGLGFRSEERRVGEGSSAAWARVSSEVVAVE